MGWRAAAGMGIALGSLLLSGCVAAIVPVIAGGAVARTQLDKHDSDGAQAKPERSANTALSIPSPNGDSMRGQPEVFSGPLPPPSGASGGTGASAIAELVDAAEDASLPPPTGETRHSALLADPSALDGKTSVCPLGPAAVIIDLDPKGATFAPLEATSAAPGLAAALARLRSDGIRIGWASSASADHADAIRQALAKSGLDPKGLDQLLLIRHPGERKQTRRQDFAKLNCVIAIAGNERPDFDELYTYIKDPSAALALEKLFAKRWFLIPQPLS